MLDNLRRKTMKGTLTEKTFKKFLENAFASEKELKELSKRRNNERRDGR